jgi:hypothetical protein
MRTKSFALLRTAGVAFACRSAGLPSLAHAISGLDTDNHRVQEYACP